VVPTAPMTYDKTDKYTGNCTTTNHIWFEHVHVLNNEMYAISSPGENGTKSLIAIGLFQCK